MVALRVGAQMSSVLPYMEKEMLKLLKILYSIFSLKCYLSSNL
jgi:hypothetical protein